MTVESDNDLALLKLDGRCRLVCNTDVGMNPYIEL